MSRIKDLMAPVDQVLADLAEGNVGAARVLLELLQRSGEIDPDCAFQGMGPVFTLDTLEIYGSRIWILYKNVCGQDLVAMCSMLRAVQLGILTRQEFEAIIARSTAFVELEESIGRSIAFDLRATHAAVKERLPRFAELPAAG